MVGGQGLWIYPCIGGQRPLVGFVNRLVFPLSIVPWSFQYQRLLGSIAGLHG